MRVQSHDAHFGHAGDRLHEWLFATRWWQPGGSAAAAGISLGKLHAASSHSIFHHRDVGFDLLRPGMSLYGGYPDKFDEERAMAELCPAFWLRARVVRTDRLRPGDSVSYGREYVAAKPTWIASIPLGHGDGYARSAVKGAKVVVGERLYPVIGAVSAVIRSSRWATKSQCALGTARRSA